MSDYITPSQLTALKRQQSKHAAIQRFAAIRRFPQLVKHQIQTQLQNNTDNDNTINNNDPHHLLSNNNSQSTQFNRSNPLLGVHILQKPAHLTALDPLTGKPTAMNRINAALSLTAAEPVLNPYHNPSLYYTNRPNTVDSNRINNRPFIPVNPSIAREQITRRAYLTADNAHKISDISNILRPNPNINSNQWYPTNSRTAKELIAVNYYFNSPPDSIKYREQQQLAYRREHNLKLLLERQQAEFKSSQELLESKSDELWSNKLIRMPCRPLSY